MTVAPSLAKTFAVPYPIPFSSETPDYADLSLETSHLNNPLHEDVDIILSLNARAREILIGQRAIQGLTAMSYWEKAQGLDII